MDYSLQTTATLQNLGRLCFFYSMLKKVFIKMGAEINTYSLAVIKSRRTFGWKKYTDHSHAHF